MKDFRDELSRLHVLEGSEFVRQLELIAARKEFHLLEGETAIYSAGNYQHEDLPFILQAALKLVEIGYKVYLLPNPKEIRTADFIVERRGIYKMYDLKTIRGKASVSNRLRESIGQTRHVLLNMAINYNGMSLARSIKKYFEDNSRALEVLVFKGNKVIQVTRKSLEDREFLNTFRKRYNK